MTNYQSCCRIKGGGVPVPPEPFVMDIESPVAPSFGNGSIVVTSTGSGTWRAVSNTPVSNFWIDNNTNNTQITKMTLIKSDGVTDMYHAFRSSNGSTYLSSLETVIIAPSADTSAVTTMRYAFGSNTSNITNIDVKYLDTSSVTDMYGMFQYATLVSPLDLSNFDTSNVTNMHYMFLDLTVETVDISMFDMSSVNDIGSMFQVGWLGEPRNMKYIKMPISLTGRTDTFAMDMSYLFTDNATLECIDRVNTIIGHSFNSTFTGTTSLVSPSAAEISSINAGLDWVGATPCEAPSSCVVEPGTNLTFSITLGQSSSGYIGYSNGGGGASNDGDQVFGSISVIDDTSGQTEFRYYAAQEPNNPEIYAHPGYNDSTSVFVNGVSGKPFWTAADVGQTFCISLDVFQGD